MHFFRERQDDTYQELFNGIVEKCELIEHPVDSLSIITDFEISTMNAAKGCFVDHIATRGCFFHLVQSTWRKIQDSRTHKLLSS